MGCDKAEEAIRLLEKAQEVLKECENANLRKATENLRKSIHLIEQSRQQ